MHTNVRAFSVFVIALFFLGTTVVQWPRLGTAWQTSPAIAVVSAGNYQAPVTPDGIAALFGVNLSTQTDKARTRSLPTSLAGVTVRINNVAAGLFFVSPGQINFLIPAGTSVGMANVSVTASDGSTRIGTVEVANAAPALFTFNGTGVGVAAAIALRVRANNTQSYEPIAQLDPATNRWQAVPLNLGAANERLFLVIYASGTRGVGNALRVLLGGVELVPSFVGASTEFVGTEQINVQLTRALIGRGRLNLSLTAPNTRASNVAEIDLANFAADVAGAPTVASITPTQAVAGETLTITGTGFSTVANGNAVIIGGVETRTVESVSATRIVVRVPYGIGSGRLAVRTALGEGQSANSLNALTTVSGVITDTQGNPLPNVAVSIANRNATTRNDGSYTVKDVPPNQAVLRIDPTSLPLTPRLPIYQRLVGVLGNRDNLQSVIALQPPDNSSVQTQGGSLIAFDDKLMVQSVTQVSALAPEAVAAAVTNGGITFDIPNNTVATLPPGVTEPRIYLTRVENSRAPAPLPRGVFSSALAQLSPFGIQLNPGAKLIFPNPDGWAANAQVALYRLNQKATSSSLGTFVTAGTATVSADGQRIETAANAITETSIYFVANLRPTTTVIGRVVDSDNTPVRNALVVCAGQLALTDGNGSFVITNVPVPANAQLAVEATFIRANGRTDRTTRTGITALAFSTTRVTPDLVLPSPATQPNRPPSLTAPAALSVNVSTTTDFPLLASDPDNQTVTVTVTGAAFASIVTLQGVPNLRLAPGATAAGNYTLTLRATDTQNAATTRTVVLTVVGNTTNRPPVIAVPGVQTVVAGQALAFNVTATDADSTQTLRLTVGTLPTGAAFTQTNGTTGRFTWTPNANQVGTVTVSFSVSDGSLSDTKTVAITVTGNIGGGFVQAEVWTKSLSGFLMTVYSVWDNGVNLFAGTSIGIFRSTDAGRTWISVNNGFTGQNVVTFAANGNFLFAGTLSGVFRSSDGGQSWAVVNNGLGNSPDIFSLATNGSTIYAGTDGGGLFRSTDNGSTWIAVNSQIARDTVRAVVIKDSLVFAATEEGQIFRSTDNGVNWTSIRQGLPTLLPIYAMTPKDNVLFLGTASGVYRSLDNGNNWSVANTGIPAGAFIYSFATSGNTLFANSAGRIFQSTDNGATWTSLTSTFPNTPVTSLVVRGNNIFAGAGLAGLLSSSNNGGTWELVDHGLKRPIIESLEFNNNTLLAGSFGLGVFRSLDNGLTWADANSGLANSTVAYDFITNGNTLFAGTDRGLFRSTNAGATWASANTGLPISASVRAFALNGATLFTGTFGTGVYRSTDNGNTWAAVNTGLTNQTILSLAVSGNTLLAGTNGSGVFRSTDNGASWTSLSNLLTRQVTRTLAANGATVFAGTLEGNYRSTDNGITWSVIDISLLNAPVNQFVISGNRIFAATLGGGVFLSTNNGVTWTADNNGLKDLTVKSLTINGNTVFAGTQNNGVYVRQF